MNGRAVPKTQEEIAKVAREYDEKIRALYAELAQLETETRGLYAQANKIMFEYRAAEFKRQQAESAARLAQMREKFEQAQRERNAQGKELADTLKKSYEDAKLRDEQVRANSQQQLQALYVQRNQLVVPNDDQRALSDSVRELTRDIQQTKPLSATEKVEQDRLQELANAGLVSGPLNSAVEGLMVIADNVASVWNRVMDVKDGFEDLGNAFDRVIRNDRPGAVERAKLVVENARDTTMLSGSVFDQLVPATDALLTGNAAAMDKIEGKLNAAMESYATAADQRAERMSPEYNAIRSGERLRDTLDTAVSPLTPPANN